jgi:hypothetical protein
MGDLSYRGWAMRMGKQGASAPTSDTPIDRGGVGKPQRPADPPPLSRRSSVPADADGSSDGCITWPGLFGAPAGGSV